MGFRDFAKGIGGEINKTFQKISVNRQITTQAIQIKKGILVQLTLSDLEHISRQFGQTKKYIGGEEDFLTGEKTPRRKITKYDYVDFLAGKPYSKLVMVMKSVGRVRLANDMEREVNYLLNKATKKIKDINNNGNEVEGDFILDAYINKIVEEITSVPTVNLKNEREYQLQLDGLFRGALKYSFKKQNPKIIMEYKTKSNRRIDILIQVGEYRIAVETKYNPQHSGEIQRAVGQSHEYSKEGIDAYILVSFAPIENKTSRENLLNLKQLLPIPLTVIAGSRVLKL